MGVWRKDQDEEAPYKTDSGRFLARPPTQTLPKTEVEAVKNLNRSHSLSRPRMRESEAHPYHQCAWPGAGGCEVWQPIHTSPPSKYSFFQIGTTSFRRSIAKRQASKASARCAAHTAIA